MKKLFNCTKKAILLVLVVASVMSLLAVNVSAAGDARLTFNTVTDHVGNNIAVCSLENYSAANTVDYIQIVLKSESYDFGSMAASQVNLLSNRDITLSSSYNGITKEYTLLYQPAVSGAFIPTDTTELFSLSFPAENGVYRFEMEYILCYTNGNDVKASKKFSLSQKIVNGDVNGDGVVDIKDLLRYKTFIADGTTDFRRANADLTGKGTYGLDDVVILKKMLLGLA